MSVLTAEGRQTLLADAGRERRAAAAAEFRRRSFVQLEGVIDQEGLRPVVERIVRAGRHLETRRVRPLSASREHIDTGFSFARLDAGPHEDGDAARSEAIRRLFDEEGLTRLGASVADAFRPLVELALERPARYDRVFVLVYREGDFIGPHGLDTTGDRINVQIPMTIGCSTAMRVTNGDALDLEYDSPGSARLLGTGFCHEVLPVLASGEEPPLRMVVSHRFVAEDGG